MKPEIKEDFLKAYKEHADALFRHCFFKVSNREIALDLVQDVYTKTWNYLSQGGEVTNMKAFLYRTANNLIIDYYRKKKPLSLDELHSEGFDPVYAPERELVNQLDGERAIQCLKKIPDSYRDVVFMRYVQELSIKEIANILDETENNVSVRLHRALERLRTVFDRERVQ
ncbi:RNA polymerase sigma factor [Candidatus Parcubacteria bacterium]|nr:RNA polymerase sigma factor [Candidatus Parcubacteria bacterium]